MCRPSLFTPVVLFLKSENNKHQSHGSYSNQGFPYCLALTPTTESDIQREDDHQP